MPRQVVNLQHFISMLRARIATCQIAFSFFINSCGRICGCELRATTLPGKDGGTDLWCGVCLWAYWLVTCEISKLVIWKIYVMPQKWKEGFYFPCSPLFSSLVYTIWLPNQSFKDFFKYTLLHTIFIKSWNKVSWCKPALAYLNMLVKFLWLYPDFERITWWYY